jgi:hypothetical protein
VDEGRYGISGIDRLMARVRFLSWSLLLVLDVMRSIVLELRADPTSHNLWPFEVLSAIVFSTAVFGLLELCRIAGACLSRGERG